MNIDDAEYIRSIVSSIPTVEYSTVYIKAGAGR